MAKRATTTTKSTPAKRTTKKAPAPATEPTAPSSRRGRKSSAAPEPTEESPTTKRSTRRRSDSSPENGGGGGTSRRSAKGAGGSSRRGKVDINSELKGLKSTWKKSRDSKASAPGGIADIPDGKYCGQLNTATIGVWPKTKEIYFRIGFTLVQSEYEGTNLTKTYTLSDEAVGDSGLTRLDLFSQDMQQLGINTSEMEADEIGTLPDFLLNPELNDNAKPYCELYVSRTEPNAKGKVYQNTYLNGLLTRAEMKEWEDEYADDDE